MSEMIIWGGTSDVLYGQPLSSGGRYDPATDTWVPTSMIDAPSGVYWPAAVWTGSEMIVWGAGGGGRYNPMTDTWIPMSSVGAPSGAILSFWADGLLLVWNDAGPARYDPVGDTWTPMSTIGAPPARSGQCGVWTGSRMIVWGGAGQLNEGGEYDPSSNAWISIPPNPWTVPTEDALAVWADGLMLIWGGHFGDGYQDPDGYRYDPISRTWSEMSPPYFMSSGNTSPSAVWTGSEMIGWFGV